MRSRLPATDTKRSAVVAFAGGFHGRTHMTMGLTGKVMTVQARLRTVSQPRSIMPNFHNLIMVFTTEQALADIDRLFHADVDPKSVPPSSSSPC